MTLLRCSTICFCNMLVEVFSKSWMLLAEVHLGFDHWSSGIQRCDLMPSGLVKEENGSGILAALVTWIRETKKPGIFQTFYSTTK